MPHIAIGALSAAFFHGYRMGRAERIPAAWAVAEDYPDTETRDAFWLGHEHGRRRNANRRQWALERSTT